MLARSNNMEAYPNYGGNYQTVPKRKVKKKKVQKTRVKQKARVNKKARMEQRIIFLVKTIYLSIPVFLLGIGFFILFRYAAITSVRLEVNKMEKHISELESEKIYLNSRIDEIKSSKAIEEDANVKLGMDYPSEGQVVYVAINDKVKDLAKSSGFKFEMDNLIDKIKDKF